MIAPRSFLFVPGDSERKMEKACASSADALVLDLEDSVSSDRTTYARDCVLQYLIANIDRNRQQIWVRINPLDSLEVLKDLSAIIAGAPDGLLLPKCSCGQQVVKLDHFLTALESREGLHLGHVKILPVATETASSVFELGSYRGVSQRLYGLTWGAEDLSTAVGASTNLEADSTLAFTYRLARSLCLLGAKGAGVHAVDTIRADFRDLDGLESEVRHARRDGFTAKFAIHPMQIDAINAGFVPDSSEIEHAKAVIAAFESLQGRGVVQLNGKMLDKPHLTQAQNTLARIRAH